MITQEIKIDTMDVDFERFRLVEPQADARMIASMEAYGQLSPVLAGKIEKKMLLVDGYKRLRAAKALNKQALQAYVVERSIMSLKAMSLTINLEKTPGREFEEALLVQSLYRDDGLEQHEIAVLCNRHKSWVCRRIALIEQLSEEVQKQLRLGLIALSTARELLRLPRGNQEEVLESLRENHLSSRRSRELVDEYLKLPEWLRKQLLRNPEVFYTPEQRVIDCGWFTMPTAALMRYSGKLLSLINEKGVGSLNKEQRSGLHKALELVRTQCSAILDIIKIEVF